MLVAILLLGNILFYEAKNQELSFQGVDGKTRACSIAVGMNTHVCYIIIYYRKEYPCVLYNYMYIYIVYMYGIELFLCVF